MNFFPNRIWALSRSSENRWQWWTTRVHSHVLSIFCHTVRRLRGRDHITCHTMIIAFLKEHEMRKFFLLLPFFKRCRAISAHTTEILLLQISKSYFILRRLFFDHENLCKSARYILHKHGQLIYNISRYNRFFSFLGTLVIYSYAMVIYSQLSQF